jgi:hypothetical protein
LGWGLAARSADDVFDEGPEGVAAGTLTEPAPGGIAAVGAGVVDGGLGHQASL